VVTRAKAKKIAEPHAEPGRSQLTKFKHPWRIVPLHTAPRLAAAVTPQLTYRNGPLLTNVEVFTVFWGAAWQDETNSAVAKQMDEFFDFVLTSKLIDQLGEFSVAEKTIGHGKRTGSLTLTTSEPGSKVHDSAIQKMLQAEIATGTVAREDCKFPLLCVFAAGHAGGTGRKCILHGLLRISRRDQRQYFLRGDAVPELHRVRGRIDGAGRADVHLFARTV
jgi:hypothetical protein